MPIKLIEAWDKNTGEKLPDRVPETWTTLFDHISATPPIETPTEEPATAQTKEEDI